MKTVDRLALTRALEVGYLVGDKEVSWMAQETWWVMCCELGQPYVAVLGAHPQRTVILNTESVVEYVLAQGELLVPAPGLTPTERTKRAVELLVRKHAQPREQAKVGGSYTALYGVWASSAEDVAQELLKVWEQAKVFVHLSSLWDEQSIGVAV